MNPASCTLAARAAGVSGNSPAGYWSLLAIAAVMVILFIRFGATTLWAFGLVAFMLAYMLLMGRWAGGEGRR